MKYAPCVLLYANKRGAGSRVGLSFVQRQWSPTDLGEGRKQIEDRYIYAGQGRANHNYLA